MRKIAIGLAGLFGAVAVLGAADVWLSKDFHAVHYPFDYVSMWTVWVIALWSFLLLQLMVLVPTVNWTKQFSTALGLPKWTIYLGFYSPVINLFAPVVFFASLGMGQTALKKMMLAMWASAALGLVTIVTFPRLAVSALGYFAIAALALLSYAIALFYFMQAFHAPMENAEENRRQILIPRSTCETAEVE